MHISIALRWLACQGIRAGQALEELIWLSKKVAQLNCKTMLEIGSRNGGSLFVLAQYCPAGAKIIAVDKAEEAWGKHESLNYLTKVIKELNQKGYHAHHINGFSHDRATIEEAEKLTQKEVDFLFIDADHRFEAVLNDWNNYRDMVRDGGIIAFHDIANDERPTRWGFKEVHKLWAILKDAYKTDEIIKGPGIGIIYKGARCSRLILMAARNMRSSLM